MSGYRPTTAQIVNKLRQADIELARGQVGMTRALKKRFITPHSASFVDILAKARGPRNVAQHFRGRAPATRRTIHGEPRRPHRREIPADLDSLDNASHCTAPAVFILAGADQLIPPRYHDKVVNAYAGPKRIIQMPAAGHDDPLTRDAAEALAQDKAWLFEMTSNPAASQIQPAQNRTGQPGDGREEMVGAQDHRLRAIQFIQICKLIQLVVA